MIIRSVKRGKWPQWERREGFSVALVLVARKQAFASAAKYALAEEFWLGRPLVSISMLFYFSIFSKNS